MLIYNNEMEAHFSSVEYAKKAPLLQSDVTIVISIMGVSKGVQISINSL